MVTVTLLMSLSIVSAQCCSLWLLPMVMHVTCCIDEDKPVCIKGSLVS